MSWGMAAAAGLSSAAQIASSFLGGQQSSLLEYERNKAMQTMQYKRQRALMKYQYQLNRSTAKQSHQWEVQDLRNAGLNPILSANSGSGLATGLGTASSGSVSQPNIDYSDAVSSALDFKRLHNETKLNQSQRELNSSQENLNDYLGDKAHYEAATAREQAQLLQDYGGSIRAAELASIQSTTAKNLQDIKNSIDMTRASIRNMNSETSFNKEQTLTHKRSNDWYREHPNWFYTNQATGALGNIFSGSFKFGK